MAWCKIISAISASSPPWHTIRRRNGNRNCRVCGVLPKEAIMPDVTVTPANVLPGDGAQYANGIAGVAITAGDVCCLDTTTQKMILADSAALATSRVRGIAAHNAAPNQPIRLQSGGQMVLGTGLLT